MNFKFLSPFYPLVTKKILIMSLLVMPEDIQIEEGFAAEWAHQPHSQMHFSNKGATAACEVDGPSLQPSTQHW